jgi:general secretion pathway protein G
MKLRVRLIALTVILVALAGGLSYSRYSSRRAREVALKQELRTMREAIDKYTFDKNQAPQSLKDLTDAQYLKEIPTDPFTRKEDWVPIVRDRMLISSSQTVSGIADIHSASTRIGRNGAAYYMW